MDDEATLKPDPRRCPACDCRYVYVKPIMLPMNVMAWRSGNPARIEPIYLECRCARCATEWCPKP